MTASTIGLVITAIAANALASVLLKSATVHSTQELLGLPPTKALVLGGFALVFYAIAFFVYAMVLKTLPVSKAYTLITFGAQAVLILAGVAFFEERYGATAWIGLSMVIVGLFLVARSATT